MKIERPRPPTALLMPADPGRFVLAPEVTDWAVEAILEPAGPLYNAEHDHLRWAQLAFQWTNVPGSHGGKNLAGTAEIPNPRGRSWSKERQLFQLHEWYGDTLPDFIITLYAPWAGRVDDATFCALVEHEMYHCAQLYRDGAPAFSRTTGLPLWTIRPHDVEEFTGVVRRYGGKAAAGDTDALIRAAMGEPEVAPAQLRAACGVCAAA